MKFNRRLYMVSTLGAAVTAALGPRQSRSQERIETTQKVEAQLKGFDYQGAFVLSGEYICPPTGPLPPWPITRHVFDVSLYAQSDETWRLYDSPGKILLSFPHFDLADFEFEDRWTTSGYNFDGFRAIRGRRFGIRVPCKKVHRKEIKFMVDLIYYDLATGRRMVYNGVGRPGTWLWLRIKNVSFGQNGCPVLISG